MFDAPLLEKSAQAACEISPILTQIASILGKNMFYQIGFARTGAAGLERGMEQAARQKRPGAKCGGPEKVSVFSSGSRKRINPSAR